MSVLKLYAIGNLGRDATKNEVSGKTVINFSICSTEKWTDQQGNKKEKQNWIDCSFWSDRTGILPYLTKGTQVFVEGVPDIRTWEKDGKRGATLTLKVGMVQLVGASGNGQAAAPATATGGSDLNNDDDGSGLPF